MESIFSDFGRPIIVILALFSFSIVARLIHGFFQRRNQPATVRNDADIRPDGSSADPIDDGAPPFVGPKCPHEPYVGMAEVVVKGKTFKLGQPKFKSLHSCAACLQTYLEANSTLCAACGEPILPGAPVAIAWVDAPHPYTHMYMGCCECGAFYCGSWGEGRLIGLPHGGSIADLAMGTGKAVIGNVGDDGSVKIDLVDLPPPDVSPDGKK